MERFPADALFLWPPNFFFSHLRINFHERLTLRAPDTTQWAPSCPLPCRCLLPTTARSMSCRRCRCSCRYAPRSPRLATSTAAKVAARRETSLCDVLLGLAPAISLCFLTGVPKHARRGKGGPSPRESQTDSCDVFAVAQTMWVCLLPHWQIPAPRSGLRGSRSTHIIPPVPLVRVRAGGGQHKSVPQGDCDLRMGNNSDYPRRIRRPARRDVRQPSR
jgi:hypothetical protein